MKRLSTISVAVAVMFAAGSALAAEHTTVFTHVVTHSDATTATWGGFVIRDTATEEPYASISLSGDNVVAQTFQSGQKVGYGTSFLDNQTIGDIPRVYLNRRDTATNLWAPYINIWVTDGSGNYGLVSIDPSTGPQSGFDYSHDMTAAEFAQCKVWIYETNISNLTWMGTGISATDYWLKILDGGSLRDATIADISHLTIDDPGAGNYSTYVGPGAPRGDYGFNWIFGDTQANYVGGYQIDADVIVPEPATMSLLALGGLGVLIRRRRRRV